MSAEGARPHRAESLRQTDGGQNPFCHAVFSSELLFFQPLFFFARKTTALDRQAVKGSGLVSVRSTGKTYVRERAGYLEQHKRRIWKWLLSHFTPCHTPGGDRKNSLRLDSRSESSQQQAWCEPGIPTFQLGWTHSSTHLNICEDRLFDDCITTSNTPENR